MCIHDFSIKHKLDGDSSVHGKLIHMYSRCGDIESAYALFLYNPHLRNVFVWNALIRAYAQLGKYQTAFDVFNQMLCEGILPDNFTMVCVITACSCHFSSIEGRRVHVRTMASRFKTDHLVGNALLNMYSKCRILEDVKKIFVEMPERNIVAWTAMIDAFLQHTCKEDALQFLCHMQGEGEFPDRVFFLTIISACSDSAAIFQGKQLHISILEMGYESDVFVRTALVNMYGNCGALDHACKVFSEHYENNVVLWNSVISLYAQFELDDQALKHFHQMLQEGVLPDRVTFIHGLSACANNAALEEGTKIHVLALSGVPVFDVMLGTTMVYMYGKCGHLEAACEAFDQLCERSVVSWNVMLGVLTQHGDFIEAFQLFGKMQKQGISPDKFTFVHILEACCSPAALAEGEQLHSYIVDMGIELDIVLGTALVNMYSKCSGIEAACRMFEKMPEHNVVSWNTMIVVHVQRGKYKDALQYFGQMHWKGISPDNATFPSILDACVSEALIRDAVLTHVYITECECDSDIAMGNALINMYGKIGSLEDALLVFKRMHAHDVLSWTAMMTVYIWNGSCEEALKLYTEIELNGMTAVKATYMVVLEACADLSDLVKGEEIFTNIVRKGLELDTAVATALVILYSKSGNLHIGKKVFNSVAKKDFILWTAMITMYAQNGLGKEAVCLFAEMQVVGHVPNNVTFVNILAACSHAGLVHEGYYFLASMVWDYGMSPLVDHYDCAIDLFGRAGLLDEAEHLINGMPFLPRIVSFMALLGACRCQADMERGERIAKRVFDLNSESSAPYVMFSNIALTREASLG